VARKKIALVNHAEHYYLVKLGIDTMHVENLTSSQHKI